MPPDASFDAAPGWLFDGMAEAFRSGAARLAIVGDDPTLLAGQDPEKVARANRARSKAYRPALELITASAINWTLVAGATPAWARSRLPAICRGGRVARLWDAIFAASRVDGPDPVAAWAAHNAALMAAASMLNERRYAALRFRGPGTDLTVGLAEGHAWMGGLSPRRTASPAIRTSRPRRSSPRRMRERVEGMVAATKPLAYQGTLIEDIAVRFEAGPDRRSHGAAAARRCWTRCSTPTRAPGGWARWRSCRTPSPISRQRAAVLQHAVRRERRQPHRPRPGLFASASSTAAR